jgi:hypothetical protein
MSEQPKETIMVSEQLTKALDEVVVFQRASIKKLLNEAVTISLSIGFVLGTLFGICIAIMFWVKP